MRLNNTEELSHWKEASKKRRVIEVASKGKKMEIKSHVMSLVLRNGGYTVSNPGFCAVSFRQFCTGRGLARHLNANVYTPETATSYSQSKPIGERIDRKGSCRQFDEMPVSRFVKHPLRSYPTYFFANYFQQMSNCHFQTIGSILLIFNFSIEETIEQYLDIN